MGRLRFAHIRRLRGLVPALLVPLMLAALLAPAVLPLCAANAAFKPPQCRGAGMPADAPLFYFLCARRRLFLSERRQTEKSARACRHPLHHPQFTCAFQHETPGVVAGVGLTRQHTRNGTDRELRSGGNFPDF